MKIWSNTTLLDGFKKHFDFINGQKGRRHFIDG